MFKKLALIAVGIASLTGPASAVETLLAPVDPLAWAVANANWGTSGGSQIESLRKIVNGQVTAHQVNGSYTDPEQRVVKRIKCSDPANCFMCSQSAREAGKKLRVEVSNSAGSAQGSQGIYAAMSTYAQAKADALNAQARWNNLRNENTITETTMVDGEEVVTTKTVKIENAADAQMQEAAKVMQQVAQSAQLQSQQQGSLVYSYIKAAAGTLNTPQPCTELFVGEDPLK